MLTLSLILPVLFFLPGLVGLVEYRSRLIPSGLSMPWLGPDSLINITIVGFTSIVVHAVLIVILAPLGSHVPVGETDLTTAILSSVVDPSGKVTVISLVSLIYYVFVSAVVGMYGAKLGKIDQEPGTIPQLFRDSEKKGDTVIIADILIKEGDEEIYRGRVSDLRLQSWNHVTRAIFHNGQSGKCLIYFGFCNRSFFMFVCAPKNAHKFAHKFAHKGHVKEC